MLFEWKEMELRESVGKEEMKVNFFLIKKNESGSRKVLEGILGGGEDYKRFVMKIYYL